MLHALRSTSGRATPEVPFLNQAKAPGRCHVLNQASIANNLGYLDGFPPTFRQKPFMIGD
jgi:hypothetical protein